jgi:hypothetical protein
MIRVVGATIMLQGNDARASAGFVKGKGTGRERKNLTVEPK